MSKLRDILKYMVRSIPWPAFITINSHTQDRVYTKQASVPEIMDQGLNLFLQRILRPPISTHLISAILAEIRVERDGYSVHRSELKGCVDVLLSLCASTDGPTVYKTDLEPAVLSQTAAFYQAEGERLLQTCDAAEYLSRVDFVYSRKLESSLTQYRQRHGSLRRTTARHTTYHRSLRLRSVRSYTTSSSHHI
jgi:cullin 3